MAGDLPPIPSRARTGPGFWLFFGLVAILTLGFVLRLVQTPIGGWVQSFFFGSGVRFEDAYVGLESSELNLPRDARERERLLLANAMVDGPPPHGFTVGQRLHPRGTLAHLRYEAIDASGERIDAWELRALVPALPSLRGDRNGESEWLARVGCPEACRTELAQHAGVLLPGSGEPGIAAEWVLRMPIGRPFDLGPRPIVTQDLLSSTPRHVPLESRRVAGRNLPWPANLRVTLLAACTATVRLGAATRLRFHDHAIVRIPRGLVTERWLQLEGCDMGLHGEPEG